MSTQPSSWRRYNIFLSSTFKDMDFERDVIKFRVIPALNRRFRDRRVELQAILVSDIQLSTATLSLNKGNDILFKVVLNENEATLPGLNPVQGVYYRWADFKALADQIMKEHPEVK